ncbi:hypothetical protein Barb6XT_02713 [Bacteroidales bacterium Barb6XT]|nr:hypothetical protein Barb6XT_02713 [Bacteroidales bacterium Barb6XT]
MKLKERFVTLVFNLATYILTAAVGVGFKVYK